MSSLEPGAEVDRYVIERRIGTGGIAGVYLVRHQVLGSLHALKVLQTWGGDLRQRLVEEGRAQARISHPNVVRVTDVVDVNRMPGLVMDYVDGIDLEQLLKEEKVSFAEAERIFRAIVAGVTAAHSSIPAVVHRDLKPANVLLHRGPRGWEPKVTDFGLAKILVDADASAQTRTGIIFGTPSYMAPEQAWEARIADRRADLFSLGCILYELCTGERAFAGPNIHVVLENIRTGAFIPPRQRAAGIPANLEQAIFACLQVDREKRVQDCGALMDILDGKGWGGQSATPPVPSEAIAPELGKAIREHFQIEEGGPAGSPKTWIEATPAHGSPPLHPEGPAEAKAPLETKGGTPKSPRVAAAEAPNPFRPPPRTDRGAERGGRRSMDTGKPDEAAGELRPGVNPRTTGHTPTPPDARGNRVPAGRPPEAPAAGGRVPNPRPSGGTEGRAVEPRGSDATAAASRGTEPRTLDARMAASRSVAEQRARTENLLLGAAAVMLVGGIIVAALSFAAVSWWMEKPSTGTSDAAPTAIGMGMVEADGAVQLVDSRGKRHPTGMLPEGAYRVELDGRSTSLLVLVVAGQKTELGCSETECSVVR